MTFTTAEIDYLQGQDLGRLATIQRDGSPQVNPVGFSYNAELGTIDIGGFSMASSQKFRNVLQNTRVAFVVDDIVSRDPWRVRFLDIRGIAEPVRAAGQPAPDWGDGALIRIRPRRIISFGVDGPVREPHLMAAQKRNVP
jgi:pyridoxamine 5'-phosphate oxidase family protein